MVTRTGQCVHFDKYYISELYIIPSVLMYFHCIDDDDGWGLI